MLWEKSTVTQSRFLAIVRFTVSSRLVGSPVELVIPIRWEDDKPY